MTFSYSKDKKVVPQSIGAIPTVKDIFKKDNYLVGAKLLCLSDQSSVQGKVTYDEKQANVTIEKANNSKSMQGFYTVKNAKKHDCSYQNYQLTIQR